MGDVPDFFLNNPCIVREWLCYTRRRLLLALWDAATAVGKSVDCAQEGWGMGLALLVLIWLITLVSTYFFVAKTWWLPVGASAAAGWIDRQFTLTFVIMGIVFLAAQVSLGIHRVEVPRERLRLLRWRILTETRRWKSFGQC